MTRVEEFRLRAGLSILAWAAEARIHRTQLRSYRTGKAEPTIAHLVHLTAAASRLTGQIVSPTEICDLGDAEPVNDTVLSPPRPRRLNTVRRYDSPIDDVIQATGWRMADLAAECRLSRQCLRELRASTTAPRVASIRQLVRAFRRLGHPVTAADLVELPDAIDPDGRSVSFSARQVSTSSNRSVRS